MEGSKSDLFPLRPPPPPPSASASSSPPFPVPASGATSAGGAASSSVYQRRRQHQQQHGERHRGRDERGRGLERDYRAKGAVHGAGIGRLEQAQVVEQQERKECNGGGTGVGVGGGGRSDVRLDDRMGYLDLGGDHDENPSAVARQVNEFDVYMPLVGEGEAGEGFQFGQVDGVLNSGAGNLPLATESEAWIAQGIDTSNYGLGNEDSIFEEAIREIINKSSQAAGYGDAAEGGDEQIQGLDATRQLDTAPQTSDSMFFSIDDVEGGSGREQVVGLPQDPGASEFVASAGVDASMSDQDLFVQAGVGNADSLNVSEKQISDDIGSTSSQVKYSSDVLEDGSDCLQGVSWPTAYEQELYPPLQQDTEFGLETEQPSDGPEVAIPQQGSGNVLVPPENEEGSKCDHLPFTEESKDDLSPLNGETSDHDEILDGADGGERVEDSEENGKDGLDRVEDSEEDGNAGVDDKGAREKSPSSPPSSKEDGMESNGTLLPHPTIQPNASEERATVKSAKKPRGKLGRPAKKHQGNGFPVTLTNSKASDLPRDENTLVESPKEGDTAPMWVKWRGKWEAAIRCCLLDCPTTTLKAKPNYSKKKHVAVYFPSARLFSWVDTEHTSPIEENPIPLLNGTHASQREAVKDGSLPRQRMLLKLGGEILDISDRLHIKAVTEPAQDVKVWKTFAKEAAAATIYAELGELLVRLHLTIAPSYIKCKWISHRYAYWKEECAKAGSAAVLQKLTKELISAVRWEDVTPLWNASEQPELDPEWEHWKGDAFEEKDSEDEKDAKARNAPRDESPIGAQLSAGSASKRFKEQARARRQNQRSGDALESSSQKRLKSTSVSPEVNVVRGPGSSSFGHATTAFRSPLVHLSPLLEDKDVGGSGGGPAAFSSGLCSAYLKRKTRRCNRQAKEDIRYCGKHKHLANPENSGKELESEGGLAWESGLCSASLGQQFTRCENPISEGSIFCQTHIHLGGTVQSAEKGEVPFSASSKEEGRCHGITNRGLQCTHKPQDGSPFCAKHLLQRTEGQDQEVEARTFVQGAEGSANKRARIPIDFGKINGSPVHIQVGQVSSHATGTHGNGLMQGSSTTTSADGNTAAENDSVTRKRKWVSGYFHRQAGHNVKSPLSQGQDLGPFLRCKGRTTRNDEQCLFRARAGHELCTKHLLASEGGRKLLLEEDSKISSTSSAVSSAKALLEKYLKSAEGIRSDAFSNAAKKQVLKLTRAEAAKDYATAEELLKLVTLEMSRLETTLRPTALVDEKTNSEMKSVLPVLVNGNGESNSITGTAKVTKEQMCGLCGLAVASQEGLGRHWRDSHRKEVILFVKGYACRQCGQLYSRKHTVRRHWRKRHHNLPVRSPDWFAVCSTCNQRFEHHDSLLQHVCAEHPDQLSSPTLKTAALEIGVGFPVGPEGAAAAETLVCDDCEEEFSTHWDLFHHKERTHKNPKNEVTDTRMDRSLGSDTKQGDTGNPSSQSELFGCRNCSKKFTSLSELGRHADAEHTLPAGPSGKSSAVSSSECGRVKLQVRRKSDELGSGFWQTAAMGPRRSKKKGRFLKQPSEKNTDKEVKKEALLLRMKAAVQTAQLRNLRQLKWGEVPTARPRKALYSLTKGGQMLPFDGDSKSGENSPGDKELLDMAQSVCCQSKLLTTLHQKSNKLPDQLLVRVSQVCTEANVELEWLADGYVCPTGCQELRLAMDTAEESTACEPLVAVKAEEANTVKDLDEIGKSQANSGHLDLKPKTVIISPDLSNGQEPVPVVCSVEQDVVDNWRKTYKDGSSSSETFKPDSFIYITERVLNPSLGVDPENYKVGCSCEGPKCSPESCDHVDIFDNDNLEALDIYGKPMKGRFPYDNNGCIILEEGYLVYECNSSCRCQQACQNRVLQKGVTVKLEVFRTLQKGWAVRAAQMIPRGTFVCEYLGEVLHDEEANKRGERYDQVGCSYLYDIDAHLDTSGRVGRLKPFVIDATKHGNVARFINHSCAPNLVNYQVLVDSMDCQLAHIGLFASRDIQNGEELAYDYRYKLLPGKGCPCHCGAPNCRGRLY